LSFFAAYYRHTETARILQNNNADPKIKATSGWAEGKSACTYNHNVGNILNCNGDLLLASRNGNLDKVNELLNNGADVNAADDSDQKTALHEAAIYGHTDVVSLLLAKGADVNVQDEYGYTPIHWAAENGHTDVVSLLLEKGADVNVQDEDGVTPIFYAALEGHKETARILQSNNADPKIKATSGYYEGKSPCSYNSRVDYILNCPG
jgi:ankyrin repeat protein